MSKRKPHKYKVGEIVKGCKILEHTFSSYKGSSKVQKSYTVFNLEHQEQIEVMERILLTSKSSSVFPRKYKSRVNSLRIKRPDLLKFLVNKEDREKPIGTPYYIEVKCPNKECTFTKSMSVDKLVSRGFNCKYCADKNPFPQKVMSAYLDLNNITYSSEVDIGNRKRMDFIAFIKGKTIAIETHGIQHYSNSTNWGNTTKHHKDTIKYKKQYCKDNNIQLIEIDCRKSEIAFIKEGILQSNLSFLIDNIKDTELFEVIQTKDKEVTEIIRLFKKGSSIRSISKSLSLSTCKITGVLERNIGYTTLAPGERNKNSVKCITTGKEFDGVKDAIEYYNLPSGVKIGMCCRGQRKSAGKHPETGEPLRWEYVNGYTPKQKREDKTI